MKKERSPEFLKAKEELIDSYMKMNQGIIFCSDKDYSPSEMADEARNETKSGVNLIKAFIKAKEKIKKLKNER